MTQPTIQPSIDPLMDLIVALLAPMFLSVADGDVTMARAAALETVNAYRARSHADLIAIAQVIAFGLAALCSLSLSMVEDLPIPAILRLHSNANALNRSAEQNRRALTRNPNVNPMQHRPAAQPEAIAEYAARVEPEAFLNQAAAQELAAASEARLQDAEPTVIPAAPSAIASTAMTEKRHDAMWAIAMVKEASEITASIPNLPAVERHAASIRAAALSSTANQLLTGVTSRPPAIGSRTGAT